MEVVLLFACKSLLVVLFPVFGTVILTPERAVIYKSVCLLVQIESVESCLLPPLKASLPLGLRSLEYLVF